MTFDEIADESGEQCIWKCERCGTQCVANMHHGGQHHCRCLEAL